MIDYVTASDIRPWLFVGHREEHGVSFGCLEHEVFLLSRALVRVTTRQHVLLPTIAVFFIVESDSHAVSFAELAIPSPIECLRIERVSFSQRILSTVRELMRVVVDPALILIICQHEFVTRHAVGVCLVVALTLEFFVTVVKAIVVVLRFHITCIFLFIE